MNHNYVIPLVAHFLRLAQEYQAHAKTKFADTNLLAAHTIRCLFEIASQYIAAPSATIQDVHLLKALSGNFSDALKLNPPTAAPFGAKWSHAALYAAAVSWIEKLSAELNHPTVYKLYENQSTVDVNCLYVVQAEYDLGGNTAQAVHSEQELSDEVARLKAQSRVVGIWVLKRHKHIIRQSSWLEE